MRKMLMTIIILMCFGTLTAPPFKTIYLEEVDKIKVYDPMLTAFMQVESNFRVNIVNHLGYTGILQEGQEMINEANRLCKMQGLTCRFTFPESALDSLESVKIWYIVQTYWNPSYDIIKAAKTWNPLSSINYYLKIKKVLLSLESDKSD